MTNGQEVDVQRIMAEIRAQAREPAGEPQAFGGKHRPSRYDLMKEPYSPEAAQDSLAEMANKSCVDLRHAEHRTGISLWLVNAFRAVVRRCVRFAVEERFAHQQAFNMAATHYDYQAEKHIEALERRIEALEKQLGEDRGE